MTVCAAPAVSGGFEGSGLIGFLGFWHIFRFSDMCNTVNDPHLKSREIFFIFINCPTFEGNVTQHEIGSTLSISYIWPYGLVDKLLYVARCLPLSIHDGCDFCGKKTPFELIGEEGAYTAQRRKMLSAQKANCTHVSLSLANYSHTPYVLSIYTIYTMNTQLINRFSFGRLGGGRFVTWWWQL